MFQPPPMPRQIPMKFGDLEGYYIGFGDGPSKFIRLPPTPANGAIDPDGFTECHLPQRVIDHVFATPGFPQPIERPDITYIAESEYGGVGMFASRDIKAGELVIAERPMVMNPRAFESVFNLPGHPRIEQVRYPGQLNPIILESGEILLEHSIKRMTKEDQAAFMELKTNGRTDGPGPLANRLQNNGFGVEIGRFETNDPTGMDLYVAVFKNISRINHSCGPSVDRVFDIKSFSLKLYAVRDIAKDEEISIAYTDILESSVSRDESLDSFGFCCECPHCIDPRSDARRAELISIRDSTVPILSPQFMKWLSEWLTDLSLPDDHLLGPLMHTLSLIETEGLESSSLYGRVLMKLCAIHAANGNKEELTKFKERFMVYLVASAGGDSQMAVLLKIMQFCILPLEGVRPRARAKSEGKFDVMDYARKADGPDAEQDDEVARLLDGLDLRDNDQGEFIPEIESDQEAI